MISLRALPLLMLAMPITAACTQPGTAPAPTPSAMGGSAWRVLEIGGEAAPAWVQPSSGKAGPAATLAFGTDGRVGGSNLCNHFGGDMRWTAEGGFARQDAPMVMTLAACGDHEGQPAQFANRFMGLMQDAQSWRVVAGELIVQSRSGTTARLTRMD